ncbi:MAG: hypothetical protein M1497_01600 [Nitrospirae bacterium]|nr:hypothetical protein [Nitrospirota bacterium]
MMITDPFMVKTFHPGHYVEYAVEGLCAVSVIVVGRLLMKAKKCTEPGLLHERDERDLQAAASVDDE